VGALREPKTCVGYNDSSTQYWTGQKLEMTTGMENIIKGGDWHKVTTSKVIRGLQIIISLKCLCMVFL
jgi:hypothetical protein